MGSFLNTFFYSFLINQLLNGNCLLPVAKAHNNKAEKTGLLEPGGPGGMPPLPQCLADQYTLSQPGRQIMPTTLLRAPFQIFRPSYGPDYLIHCVALISIDQQ